MESNILQTISYFDVFNHPLSCDEIGKICGIQFNNIVIQNTLTHLVNSNKCYQYDGFYSIQQDVKTLVNYREGKEEKAKKYFKKLPFYVQLISSFPFVKGIAISGSLSKGVMHDNGDIDYFIIAAKGRMWICRSLLILFKKIFLFNSKKYFCLNYFIDEDNLEIQDKNIFTAMEINYLIAVHNKNLIEEMKLKNAWTESYLSSFEHPLNLKVWKGNEIIKKILEMPFHGKIGDKLDFILMKKTYQRWSKKFKHFDSSKLELTMRSNRGVSKHHPRDFQTKVLEQYAMRIEKFNLS